MSRYVFKLPDLGEGTVEAELIAWHIKPGDFVHEDQVMAEVMTEKAAVEVPAPVTGHVVATKGKPGEMVPVGADLVVFETGSEAQTEAVPPAATAVADATAPRPAAASAARAGRAPVTSPGEARPAGRVMASPATRRRAHEAGVDLQAVVGSGPGGRITRLDVASALERPANARATASLAPATSRGRAAGGAVEEIKVMGLRRQIAQRLSEAKRTIPHFSYVEEVDVTELEALRVHLNRRHTIDTEPLSYLPFIIAALARTLAHFPQCNAHYDAERGVILRHSAVHVGVATQTPDGLVVPVVKHAEGRSLGDLAAEIRRVAEAARTRKASREELSGSTITITSLGKLGGIVSTPVINMPEVSVIGVNRAVERPVVHGGAVVVRRMMNLSSSFDHRFVDGYDAASMIRELKERLEHPATIFI